MWHADRPRPSQSVNLTRWIILTRGMNDITRWRGYEICILPQASGSRDGEHQQPWDSEWAHESVHTVRLLCIVYSLRLSLTYPKCLKHFCANSVLMLEVALVPLCLPVRDSAVFEDTQASGERFTTFPISHRVNNSTFNIKTGSPGGNNSCELLISLLLSPDYKRI